MSCVAKLVLITYIYMSMPTENQIVTASSWSLQGNTDKAIDCWCCLLENDPWQYSGWKFGLFSEGKKDLPETNADYAEKLEI